MGEFFQVNCGGKTDSMRAMKILRRFGIPFEILFLIVLLFSPPIHAQKPATGELLVLTNVTVVDVRTGPLQPEQTVILERNHIASVGPSKSAKYPRNAASVNCRELFLIPGLWDMHVHLVFGDWFPDAQEISLPLFVANGVTGVRDMGSELDIVQGWRNEIEAGRLIGPRIYASGPMRWAKAAVSELSGDCHARRCPSRGCGSEAAGRGLHQAAIADSARCGFCHRGRSQEAGDTVRRTCAGYGAGERDVRSRDEKFRAPHRYLRGEFAGGGRILEGKQDGREVPCELRSSSRCFTRWDAGEESNVAMPNAGVGTRRQSDRRERFQQGRAREIRAGIVEK